MNNKGKRNNTMNNNNNKNNNNNNNNNNKWNNTNIVDAFVQLNSSGISRGTSL